MSEFRFIHCSDLHLETPFSGIALSSPMLQDKLRRATFKAFQNIVDLAIKEEVDAVVIAGDTFDSSEKNLQAQLKFRNGLRSLTDAGIPSYVAHGNHDPSNSWFSSIKWPEAVTIFPGNRVEAVPLIRNGEVITTFYGISFSQREIHDNLAKRFESKGYPGFSIAVLHTNVGGQSNHDNYAPCNLKDMIPSKMDYWALGHIHKRQILRNYLPAVAYCGNSQSRSFKEPGEKGCYLVTLKKNIKPDIQFIPTDVIRFEEQSFDIAIYKTFDALIDALVTQIESQVNELAGRDLIFRMTLTGSTPLHLELQKAGTLEAVSDEALNRFEGIDSRIWLDLKLKTNGLYNIDQLRKSNDFLADLLSLYDEKLKASNSDSEEWEKVLKPIFQNWPGQRFLDPLTPEDFEEIILKARTLTLDPLIEKY